MIKAITFDGGTISKNGLYSGIPIQIYHGPGLCDGHSLSSSGARKIFEDSPLQFKIEDPDNPNRIDPKESEARLIGWATHHLSLGEPNFWQHFAVLPDEFDSLRSKDARAWKEKQEQEGRAVLKRQQYDQVRGMCGALPWQEDLEDSGLANNILVRGGLLNGLIEHSLIWKDKETGVWLRSRPDNIADETVHSDLKTTTSVEMDHLWKTVSEFRYDMQAALARIGMREVCGIDLTTFAFVFVQKTPPYAVQVVEMKEADMDEAEKDLRVAIRVFARCHETGRWFGPNGTQKDGAIVGLTEWARKRADYRRADLERELAA